MDNASKALIMAGGILITVMIISLSLYLLTSARGVANASEESYTSAQIVAFNSFFINFPSEIRGIDVYNIIGKIEDIRNDESSVVQIPANFYSGPDINSVDDTREFCDVYSYSYEFGSNGAIARIYIN